MPGEALRKIYMVAQPALPPPPLGEVLTKGEQEYLKVLQAGYKVLTFFSLHPFLLTD
jgi:hypothetical protein